MNDASDLLYANETYAIRGAAFEVYKEMGNAFEEPVYQECMELALKEHGIPFEAQVINYLRLTGCKLGLLINFGAYPKATIDRIIYT